MNTTSKIIRKISAALAVGLTLAGTVHAATPSNDARNAQGGKPPVAQTCKDKVIHIMDGNNKTGLYPVTVHECTPPRKVKFWTGPRNTIPVYEDK